MSKSSKRRKAQERKQQKRQQKDAMRKQYQQWARDGINKKSKRRVLAAKRSRLVKDHKQVNVAAVLARPKLEVLFCTWQEDSYAGSFYLLWRRCGKLYEMSLSHCSCNAYSDGEVQDNCWSRNPEITVAYLRQRACPVNSWNFSSEEEYAAAKLSWDTLLKELES